jgi:hypothetical protein
MLADFEQLRRSQPPTRWGAIAWITLGGVSAETWNEPTREGAESKALDQCRRKTGTLCKVLAAAETQCAALAMSVGGVAPNHGYQTVVQVRPTLATAIETALARCRADAPPPENCAIRATFCADGGHPR